MSDEVDPFVEDTGVRHLRADEREKVTGEGIASIESTMEAFVKKLKFWISIVLLLAGAGWAVATYLGNFAKADALSVARDQLDKHNARLGVVEASQADLKNNQDRVESKIDRMGDQLLEVARTVRAPVVEAPMIPPRR